MIAEFMLQRTRADQVVPVYEQFTKKFPDFASLSVTSDDAIKDLIESLGLHWRYAHFKKAAQFVISEYNGKIPADRKKMLKIPGAGEYVAGIVLAVAFNKREWVVDSNIARAFNRFFGLKLSGEIRRKKEIIEIAKEYVQTTRPRKAIFGILDFSALICLPGKPLCGSCILVRRCLSGLPVYWRNNSKKRKRFIQPLQYQILPNKIFPFSLHFTSLFERLLRNAIFCHFEGIREILISCKSMS
ncbi:MAG: DNA glycosylase [Candidatus Desantisbacteria bacterium]